ncbi:phosphoglycolate phosphatase 1B chloroplastic-like [Prunus yedoensis var. nudiflora]|uniref:phosphoglycolate phosphatase n=1 Tax=Prunus yedoensis var. nudiflora TaxID=2094558 RepID=A0A314YH27_PRUYE|nr:phosphoglycolate phosphatase 1B chloroplastic-like [Prunus yedoensis var. nudiflora]
MLSRTTAIAASLSVSAGSANPSKSNYSRLLGLNNNLSYTASNPVIVSSNSNFASFAWNTSNNSNYTKSRMERFTTRASAQPLTNADELIDSVQTFIFDCDGVIWKGDKLIDGVPETLDLLRSKGKRLVFVTNNSTKSRKQYGKKFETLGLNVNEEEIFASSFAAAAYLKSINFPKDKKVYVIGEEGILKELELAGYQYLGGPEDGGKKIDLKPGFLMEHDENVGAVVVGFDRNFNYYKIQYGTLCIRENPGCLFIATNRDAVTHLTDAQEWAGSFLSSLVALCVLITLFSTAWWLSMVGAIRGSTQREPLVVGKPSTFMMDYLANEFGILKSQICMVGDRLDTDILFGQNGGCKTLLVLSGVTTLSVLQSPNNSIQPDFYTNKISDFLSLKATTV